MQPNQTMVGPIAKQCLEGLGCPPSLWSLETLVNAGIILGFNRSSTLPPSTHMHTLTHCACRHTHGHWSMHKGGFGPGCSSLTPILLSSDATPAAEAQLLIEHCTETHKSVLSYDAAHLHRGGGHFVHSEVSLWLWYCMRWLWCLSRTPFNQWAASSSSNYCSGRPSPPLSNLSITHFHFFPGSHKSLVLSLLQPPSKRPRGSLDTCVNNRWQVPPTPHPPLLFKAVGEGNMFTFSCWSTDLTTLLFVSIVLVSLCIFTFLRVSSLCYFLSLSLSRPSFCVSLCRRLSVLVSIWSFLLSLSLSLFLCQRGQDYV